MADLKITELTALTTPDGADLLPIVDDVAGTPITKKITLSQIGIPKVIYKSADETVNNSSVLQDDDHLTFAVAANEVWAFSMFLFFASGVTPDLKIKWSVPSGTTMLWADDDAIQTALSEATTKTISCQGLATTQIGGFNGQIQVSSTSGSVTLQWAQNTQEATDSKILKGSYIIAHRLA